MRCRKICCNTGFFIVMMVFLAFIGYLMYYAETVFGAVSPRDYVLARKAASALFSELCPFWVLLGAVGGSLIAFGCQSIGKIGE